MKIQIKLQIILLALISVFSEVNAQDGLSIMKKNRQALSSNDEIMHFTMNLTNKNGKVRTRELTQVQKTNEEDNRSFLIRFLSPADVEGTGFLEIENSNRDNDQWLYLPALKRSRRISASNKVDNFMGSDFTYEDIERENIQNFNYKILRKESLNSNNCVVIEATPKNELNFKTGYSKRLIYVCEDNDMVLKTEYYNHNNQHCKTYYAEDVKQTQGVWRTYKMSMNNILTNHSTVIVFTEYKINTEIDSNLFSQRYLEQSE